MARQTIFKRKRTSNFTTIPNATLEDSGLTWEARGLLVYLLSKPAEWRVSVSQLIKAGPSSRRIVYRILQELQDTHYIIKTQLNDVGKFGTVCYEVYDEPHTRIVKADNEEDRLHENRKAVTAVADSVTLVKKEIVKKDINKKQVNIAFAEFWDLYNKKRGDVGKIEKKWNALSDKDRQLAMDYIPRYIKSEPNKRYRKDPTTFLNNKSWNDEIIELVKPKSGSNGVDVFTPILREIRRVGGYGTPEFKEWEMDARQMVKQLGWGNCCTMTEFDLRQSVNNNMSLSQ